MTDPSQLRCSGFARSEDLDPAGTAGTYRAFAALELPLPWAHEITGHPDVVPAAAALAAAGVRVQGLVPDPANSPGQRRMLTFVRPAGAFFAYRSAAWTVPGAAVADALVAFASSVGAASASGDPDEATAGDARRVAVGADTGRHVLLCTHGKRDACCGSLGTRLASSLLPETERVPTDDGLPPPRLGAGVHVWRTSHTGGHRFAPTAVLLPEGTAWAYLDLDSLVGIADRTLDAAAAARRYRGCTGLGGPEVQACDREALRSVGWAWLDHRREGAVVAREGGRSRVRLTGVAPDGRQRVFEATVEVARSVPVPDCGRPIAEARKSAPELRVSGFAAA